MDSTTVQYRAMSMVNSYRQCLFIYHLMCNLIPTEQSQSKDISKTLHSFYSLKRMIIEKEIIEIVEGSKNLFVIIWNDIYIVNNVSS